MFKYSSLLGTFTIPPPNTTIEAPINMISSITSGSHGSYDHWVVPSPTNVDYYGDEIPLTTVRITYLAI